jgi:hypothetical protein
MLYGQGDREGARDLLEQALDADRRVLGDEHPETRTSGRAPDAQLD